MKTQRIKTMAIGGPKKNTQLNAVGGPKKKTNSPSRKGRFAKDKVTAAISGVIKKTSAET